MSGQDLDSDLFELLDVPHQEDSYSRVLANALRVSARLREHAWRLACPTMPRLRHEGVHFRHGVERGSIVDLFLVARDEDGRAWAMFIENKVHADESPAQTQRYLGATRTWAGAPERGGGIFLTLTGEAASAAGVQVLTHRGLATTIAELMDDFADHPLLKLALESYVKRATVRMPVAHRHARVGDLLADSRGLVPALAGPIALGNAIAARTANGLSCAVVWIQGRGHANPGLVFRGPGWAGEEAIRGTWTPENIDVHLEVELVNGDPGPIKVHLETSPYKTQAELAQLANAAGFFEFRDSFRREFHARAAGLPGWRLTKRPLQAAVSDPELDENATVGEVVDAYGASLDAIAGPVDEALAVTRRIRG